MFKFFSIFFDEAQPAVNDGGSPVSKMPEGVKLDSSGSIDLNMEEVEKKIDEKYSEKEETESEEDDSEDDTTEEDSEEDGSEDSEDADEDEDADQTEDGEHEDSEDSDDGDADQDEDEELPPNVAKRLKDTQTAYHEARKENKELKERLDALEKKVTPPADGKKKDDQEVTLENIDPEVLKQALAKDPITTQRWIAAQQVKLSLRDAAKADEARKTEEAFESQKAQSEQIAVKRFPVLGRVLKMSDEKLAEFKTKHPEQYEFAQKTVAYFKDFSSRKDAHALMNAAARAYADLSPKTLAKIREETKKKAKQEFSEKTKVIGKLKVVSGDGTKGKSKGFKQLSDEEFGKLTPQQQDEYFDKSVESKFKK